MIEPVARRAVHRPPRRMTKAQDNDNDDNDTRRTFSWLHRVFGIYAKWANNVRKQTRYTYKCSERRDQDFWSMPVYAFYTNIRDYLKKITPILSWHLKRKCSNEDWKLITTAPVHGNKDFSTFWRVWGYNIPYKVHMKKLIVLTKEHLLLCFSKKVVGLDQFNTIVTFITEHQFHLPSQF